tara:strand:+ start:1248 stop:1955 length:708 start_codon:yes stop_codon:yes gene_type:complete
MDFNEQVKKAVDKVINEKMELMMEKTLEKSIESIVEDSLRSYSDFGKLLKEKINTSLNVSLDGLELIDYTTIIVDKIKKIATEDFIERNVENITEQLGETLGKLEPEYKLSDLIEKFKDSVDDYDVEQSNSIFFECEYNEEYKWHKIKIDRSEDCSLYNSEIEFTITKENNIICPRMKTTFHDKKEGNGPIKRSSMDSFQMLIMKLNSQRNVKIIVDENYIDTYHSEERIHSCNC